MTQRKMDNDRKLMMDVKKTLIDNNKINEGHNIENIILEKQTKKPRGSENNIKILKIYLIVKA